MYYMLAVMRYMINKVGSTCSNRCVSQMIMNVIIMYEVGVDDRIELIIFVNMFCFFYQNSLIRS